jgi:cation diffusion facilitator CzcD-associated flavoprotein CzcO
VTDEVDVAIVGAGFAGMYMLHRARGLGLTARAIEAWSGVGGTWYWNRYPGAAATSSPSSTPTASPRSWPRSGSGPSDTPHEGVDLAGLRVGLIGTGSSGIQSIPVIAAEAAHLTVFQRTPAYSVPAHNGPLDPAEQAEVKARYAELRAANRQLPSAIEPTGIRTIADHHQLDAIVFATASTP